MLVDAEARRYRLVGLGIGDEDVEERGFGLGGRFDLIELEEHGEFRAHEQGVSSYMGGIEEAVQFDVTRLADGSDGLRLRTGLRDRCETVIGEKSDAIPDRLLAARFAV